MRILVAACAYPTNDGKRPLYYVHSRNLYYIKEGVEVVVLNFATKKSYVYDGIKVISLEDYTTSNDKYDMLLCHAANIRNHYLFLKKYGQNFDKKMFIFHGHEVLHINKYYPKPYFYVKQNNIKVCLQNVYDDFKLSLWRKYYLKNIKDLRLVFVSNWIYKQFLSELNIDENQIKNHASIISNSVGIFFEENNYHPQNTTYDFITIRGYLDGSKYGVDIVVDLANKHPEYKFLIVGNGEFFNHFKKPDNVTWIKGEMSHSTMEKYLNESKYAILPTREDTQGLIACEFATFGIPLITSDIEVCREVFKDCPNVSLIDNENPDLNNAISQLKPYKDVNKWETYFAKNTIYKEIEYIKNYINE